MEEAKLNPEIKSQSEKERHPDTKLKPKRASDNSNTHSDSSLKARHSPKRTEQIHNHDQSAPTSRGKIAGNTRFAPMEESPKKIGQTTLHGIPPVIHHIEPKDIRRRPFSASNHNAPVPPPLARNPLDRHDSPSAQNSPILPPLTPNGQYRDHHSRTQRRSAEDSHDHRDGNQPNTSREECCSKHTADEATAARNTWQEKKLRERAFAEWENMQGNKKPLEALEIKEKKDREMDQRKYRMEREFKEKAVEEWQMNEKAKRDKAIREKRIRKQGEEEAVRKALKANEYTDDEIDRMIQRSKDKR